MGKMDIKALPFEKLKLFIEELGEKTFRAKQIFQWLHSKNVDEFAQMTSLSKDLRDKLEEKAYISQLKLLEKQISSKDETIKYLFEVENSYIIESVLMRYDYGNSVCISSQVGCKMGCTFCASTVAGLERNLTSAEMVSQIYEISKDIGERISHVVVMGCGEPLDNFDNLIDFIEIINSEEGANIGSRHITVSTCGIVENMYRLADMKLQITLAVSLHAPNDVIRKTIMPVTNKYPMDMLLKACKYYTEITKRRITFEYALISGVNDSKQCAKELAEKLQSMLCHVNLITVNEIEESAYKQSGQDAVNSFMRILKEKGIEATVRRKLGNDIDAACGQLRNRYIKEQ